MKAYATSTSGKPPNGRFPCWASLGALENDQARVGYKNFCGRPYPRQWRSIDLFIETPFYPRPDFYGLGVNCWVMNNRAVELTREVLEMTGELLPVSIKEEDGEFYIYNCTNCLNVLDSEKAIWRHGKRGSKVLVRPSFLGERFGDESLFKFPEDGACTTYCLERSGDPEDGEFKALVAKHRLTGLDFEQIWTDED